MTETYKYFVSYKRKSEDILEDVKRWHEAKDDKERAVMRVTEVLTWMATNLEEEWARADGGYCFELESDAMAFKLRWIE